MKITIDPTKFAPSKNADVQPYTAGADLLAGSPVYRDPKNSTMKPVSSSLPGPTSEVYGLACGPASAGQRVLVVKKDKALVLGADVQPGDILVAGEEAGTIIDAADLKPGNVVTVLGVVDAGGKLVFQPVGASVASPVPKS